MQNRGFKFAIAGLLAGLAVFMAACGGSTAANDSQGNMDPNSAAATVNGKPIKMEEVERAIKQQARGQESKMSPLELAGARLQVLESLIEQEVMYQKAEEKGTVPTDEEVAAEVNNQKVSSHQSAEDFNKAMTQAGYTEADFRENIKKQLAIKKLVDKITGQIETPKDSEIESFFNGSPEMFVKKRGVRLAAIVIDPSNSGEGDTTTNEAEATTKANEVLTKIKQPNSDFAALASEYSEDPSKLQGGDLGFLSEDDLKQNYPQLAAGFMSPQFTPGQITAPVNINGKLYIFKLQERNEKEESQTLESPGVREQIIQMLVDNRKQLLAASYQTIAMNDAKIVNFLAKRVVDNPNELTGARPAGSGPTNTNTAAPANSAAPTNANANANVKPATNTAANAAPAKPAAIKPTAPPAGKPAAKAPANK